MGKKFLIPMIIFALIGIIGVGWQIISSNIVKEANQMIVSSVDLSSIQDGSYTGEYILSPVKVEVEVVVKNNEIYDIKILEHQNGFGEKAEAIIEEIIEKQKLNVDLVSGATVSSKVILKAVENALGQ
ncbi:FMN-binding domain protein [[Clostridium] ultunense Esp]|uniref:FMN-binding domain protein n=1 Tax=[Clostridium] ultunense Esp TaxID=1288971 RepID=M1ZJY7_9FIRM|nr:FMN-binding protein [Schnuerera ultunensis]CCQ94572.1 FMN-binding domain protein [[Clostridium] ultunense Esp]SHD76758.1 FMN-binding domain protein [[Clostridium] ultunense Esp]